MKKITLLVLIALSLRSGAQSYQRMLADSITVFNVVNLMMPIFAKAADHNSLPVINSNCIWADWGNWRVQTDSTYKAIIYKRIFDNYNQMRGLMREDSTAKKVYFIPYCDTIETLLYDFSLIQGNTISYTFTNSGQMPSGTYTVDSIILKHDYKTFYRKHFFLREHSNTYNPTLELIEGVGNVNHPLFLYYWYQMGVLAFTSGCTNTTFDELVSCKWDNGNKIYFDSCAYAAAQTNGCIGVQDSCDYHDICGGIENFSGLKNISVYPNPASEKISISTESEKEITLSFSIVTILGVEVKKQSPKKLSGGKNISELDVRNLADGIYILKISDGTKTLNKNLIVSH